MELRRTLESVSISGVRFAGLPSGLSSPHLPCFCSLFCRENPGVPGLKWVVSSLVSGGNMMEGKGLNGRVLCRQGERIRWLSQGRKGGRYNEEKYACQTEKGEEMCVQVGKGKQVGM